MNTAPRGWILTAVVAAVLLGVIRECRAEDSVILHLGSYHLDRNGQNEINPGIGYAKRMNEQWRLIGGAYNNSGGDLAVYVGGVRHVGRAFGADWGVMGVVAWGYMPSAMPMPIVGSVAQWKLTRDDSINLGFVPGAGGVFWLTLERKLK